MASYYIHLTGLVFLAKNLATQYRWEGEREGGREKEREREREKIEYELIKIWMK